MTTITVDSYTVEIYDDYVLIQQSYGAQADYPVRIDIMDVELLIAILERANKEMVK